MLDHVFTDAIGALRDALESALLERLSPEEHFHVDIVLGDTTWETTYVLPGEGLPPRVRADISLEWSTWSQSAFRSWVRGEDLDDDPRIDVSVVLRIQRLADPPDLVVVLGALPERSAGVGAETLQRGAPTVETLHTADLQPAGHAVEVAYEGGYELDERSLGDPSMLDEHISDLGGWIASMLVRLGDLPLAYRQPTG